MIEARKLRLWDGRYNLVGDGRCVATWEMSHWSTGGPFELEGRRFTVRANLLGDEASLVEAGGRRIGTAHGFGRKHWREEKLHEGGRRLDSVRRTSLWRVDAAADLPGLPRVGEVFAIAMALTRWESDAAATG